MKLRHLEYFATAARLGSVSKAATVLHTTQPSLSRQIHALEVELGHRLLERIPSGVTATPAGLGLLHHLDTVFLQIERIPEIVRQASKGARFVNVGVPQGLPHGWFLRVVDEIEERLPGLRLSLTEATTEEQRQLIQEGSLDLALLHTEAPELETLELFAQRIGIVVRPDSALASRAAIGFADLDGLRIMAHAPGEINSEETRIRAATMSAGVEATWVFRRFSEHSELIARTAEVDAVFVTPASALLNFRDWIWIPMEWTDPSGEEFGTSTFLAWHHNRAAALKTVISVFEDVGGPDAQHLLHGLNDAEDKC